MEKSKGTHRADRATRRAFVTGASAGIGAAFAARLARDRYDLVVVARGRARLDQLAAQLRERHGVAVQVVAADLTIPAHLHRVEETLAKDEALELLVNNAGFGTAGAFATLDPDREEEQIRLNIVALTRLTRAALPGMIGRRRGAVINVSSLAAFQPGPHTATYAATKAYVNSFTEALSEELRGTGVLVQALCPGFTRTEFQRRAGVDATAVPSFAWMTPEAVVDASLAGLRRGGVICIPGFGNRMLAATVATIPRAVVRRLVGVAGRQMVLK